MVQPPSIEATVELGLFVVLAFQAARILAQPVARRELREQPLALSAVVVVGSGAVAILLWAALASAMALRAFAATALLIWSGLAWRRRSAYGASKGLPPGPLSLRRSLDAVVDRRFYLHEAERHGPVFKMAQFHRPAACVLGLERGRELLGKYRQELLAPPLPLNAEIPRGFLRYMAPADYQVYAPLFRAAFVDTTLTANQAFLHERARAQLDDLSSRSLRTPGGLHPRRAIDVFMTEALVRVFFGRLLAFEDLETVTTCVQDGVHVNTIGRASKSSRRALERFSSLVLERNASSTDEVGPCIWSRLLDLEPETAVDATVLGNLFVLLQASHDSIGNLLIWVLKMLGEHQAWVTELRTAPQHAADGAGSSRSGLPARVVLETLRLSSSEYVYRRVAEPIEVDGFTIPKGWLLRVLVGESHLLDPPFERPFEFNPDRHLDRSYSTNELSPFGLDHHACLGAWMTLFLARVFTEELSQYDWTVPDDGPPERGNRHWRHWTPSSRLRVVMSPAPAAAVARAFE